MRLLNTSSITFQEFADGQVPRYAILSHTWGAGEVTLQEVEGGRAEHKEGYGKITRCCLEAKNNGFDHVWIDTCCIDKTSSAELSEAINSMYRWYQEADECYAYLADVSSMADFSNSRWFTRGWTLQELIAPSAMAFYDQGWKRLGTKQSLQQELTDCTRVPVSVLSGRDGLEKFSIAQRMSWASNRKTTRIEDRAYCLLGIFGINMPLIYGEKETSFIRLQEEIMKVSDDHSLFAWRSRDSRGGVLATSPAAFADSNKIVEFSPFDTLSNPLTASSRGVHLELRFIGVNANGLGLAILNCKQDEGGGEDKPIAIHVRDTTFAMAQFERVRSSELEQVDLRKYRQSAFPLRRMSIQKGRKMYEKKPIESGSESSIIAADACRDGMPGSPQMTLLEAAERGLHGAVWLLLTRSDVEASLMKEGQAVLSRAVERGHRAVIKVLLVRNEINPDLRDEHGRTLLLRAAQGGRNAVVEPLLRSGKADAESEDENGRTPLSWAAGEGHAAAVKLLLERGAKVESKDKNGRTPLSFAAGDGHGSVVELLLDWNAEAESKDKNDRTPLSWAAGQGHGAAVKLLLERGAKVESKNKNGRTPLSFAAGDGHEAVIELLLEWDAEAESKDKNDRTPLSWAAGEGHGAAVKFLLERGAKIRKMRMAGHRFHGLLGKAARLL
ncbi:ankyrin repeat-containing domain protein [Cladorrhinum samala]|uniref:Ankyrin repeat-containing domain protein n=1 Tax=Cladorrhinum samala TaxID=585594 RepID=A0AAV9HYC1_9PEZI|nr:ankyrin repeat-containing domain protein [Cladorrhinum samala]